MNRTHDPAPKLRDPSPQDPSVQVDTCVPEDSQDSVRAQLARAIQAWVLAQHLPQRVIADRLKIPRSVVSEICTGKTDLSVEKLTDIWSALGGKWELRLTLGERR